MTVSIQFDIDAARVMGALEVMPAAVDIEAARAMETSVFVVEAEVKALTPRKTGRLFSGWGTHVHAAPGLVGIVSNRVSYAGYVEEGTGPHDIVAHGNALKFNIGGTTFFRKSVHHPGFAGRHMARLGLTAAKPAVIEIFRRAMKRAVEISLAFGK